MKKSILFFGIVALVLATIGIGRAAEKTVVIATLIEMDPVALVAKKVMTQAYKKLGITMELKNLPGERALLAANEGQFDGELMRREGIEQTYPNLVRIPVPIHGRL